jgi:hypothetical protein
MMQNRLLTVLALVTLLIAGGLGYQNYAASQAKADDKSPAEPRIVAAGTAVYTRPNVQDNTTVAHVKLPADIAKGIGEDYIVLLTMRAPVGGYPYFNCYWRKSDAGFDILLADTTVTGPGGRTASYTNRNKDYPVDWIVVKKGPTP